jgi:hypothetical protein
MTAAEVLCARCHKAMQRQEAIEAPVEQGTSSNLLYIHRDPCVAPPVRRRP